MSLPKRVVLTMKIQRMIANHPLTTKKNIESLISNNVLSVGLINKKLFENNNEKIIFNTESKKKNV